ncbi:hypothetical protein O6H91_03G130800 [Diphasiastrum complanatum]|uniref:Uncharacterized protein n=2 Tax=Diphasiastrum complanatum TaxID=34168 RepID=A0ACC2EBQ4_DIPCM|nr:hypothetical protein O6H91_03G130800 [Diphasiastrum complanatum]KAJ7563930.1 hypothetical protein O6H91_03G130800 [Diphasiastrum complanatum]
MAMAEVNVAALPGLALVGAGIFARAQYIPHLRNMKDVVSLRAIWSRSQDSVQSTAKLVHDFAPEVEIKWGADGLREILKNESIHSVAIVLAGQAQLEIVHQALKAGKHVLQEKPIGPNVAEVRNAISLYRTLHATGGQAPIWALAENYRFEPGLLKASDLVRDLGDMMAVEVIVELPMEESNPYFSSSWRRDSSFPGGFMLDGGVHFTAGLRLITGSEVKSVMAIARHVDASLPPPDNVSALLQLENECAGVMVMSYSSRTRKVSWRVVGSRGTVEVERGINNGQHGYTVTHCPAKGSPQADFFPFAGVQEELKSFVKDVAKVVFEGKSSTEADQCSSVVEAFRDVAVIEAMLISSQTKGGAVQVEHHT